VAVAFGVLQREDVALLTIMFGLVTVAFAQMEQHAQLAAEARVVRMALEHLGGTQHVGLRVDGISKTVVIREQMDHDRAAHVVHAGDRLGRTFDDLRALGVSILAQTQGFHRGRQHVVRDAHGWCER
jgi:hypothetical protein